jgi:hypothetical protein
MSRLVFRSQREDDLYQLQIAKIKDEMRLQPQSEYLKIKLRHLEQTYAKAWRVIEGGKGNSNAKAS